MLSSDMKKRLAITPSAIDSGHLDFSKKPNTKVSDFCLPQTPTFTFQMLSEMQDSLRAKEIDLIEAIKIKKQLEYENE